MLTLGFGFRVEKRFQKVKNGKIFDNGHDSWNQKCFCFDVLELTMDEFDDLDQQHDHPDRNEWDEVLDEACCVGTTECCDTIGSDNFLCYTDFNVPTKDENLIKACEILRLFFIRKGFACSEIKEKNLI